MKKIITVILLLMMFITGYAQRIVVYKQLDESLIKVSASSELNKGTICSVVNGDGMQGCYHIPNHHSLVIAIYSHPLSTLYIPY